MNIVDAIYSFLPAKRKSTPSGWTKFNAVCCSHNGQTPDTRQRGGIIQNGTGVSYHCFNCGFKANYQEGRHLNRKMKQLLFWLGAPDDVINKIALEALKTQSEQQYIESTSLPTFENKSLPEDSMPLVDAIATHPDSHPVAEYMLSRGFSIDDCNWHWSPSAGFADRLIIPFTYEGRTVGFTSRKISNGKPRYLSDQHPNFVFNLDAQQPDSKFVIVVEGPMDALSINGVAILGAELHDKQAMLINRLHRTVILVPDRDKTGMAVVDTAIKHGWSVSMPDWSEDIKDTNDACRKYGRLLALHSIVKYAESNELKIRLRMKKWFSND